MTVETPLQRKWEIRCASWAYFLHFCRCHHEKDVSHLLMRSNWLLRIKGGRLQTVRRCVAKRRLMKVDTWHSEKIVLVLEEIRVALSYSNWLSSISSVL